MRRRARCARLWRGRAWRAIGARHLASFCVDLCGLSYCSVTGSPVPQGGATLRMGGVDAKGPGSAALWQRQMGEGLPIPSLGWGAEICAKLGGDPPEVDSAPLETPKPTGRWALWRTKNRSDRGVWPRWQRARRRGQSGLRGGEGGGRAEPAGGADGPGRAETMGRTDGASCFRGWERGYLRHIYLATAAGPFLRQGWRDA